MSKNIALLKQQHKTHNKNWRESLLKALIIASREEFIEWAHPQKKELLHLCEEQHPELLIDFTSNKLSYSLRVSCDDGIDIMDIDWTYQLTIDIVALNNLGIEKSKQYDEELYRQRLYNSFIKTFEEKKDLIDKQISILKKLKKQEAIYGLEDDCDDN